MHRFLIMSGHRVTIETADTLTGEATGGRMRGYVRSDFTALRDTSVTPVTSHRRRKARKV